MPKRDIVTIGGSAGSVAVFSSIARGLPADLDAAVFIVIHLAPRQLNFLVPLIQRATQLRVKEPVENEPIAKRTIYVAPPDHHMLIGGDHVHLNRRPKEGLQRPSINVTFRSAAASAGPRVIGVLVSGMLDDGVAGLWEVANRGGITIVQDPAEAQFPSMPARAIADATVHYTLPAAEIAPKIQYLVEGEGVEIKSKERPEVSQAMDRFTGYTCPECRGPLYERIGPGPTLFHCRIGHVLSPAVLFEEHTSTQERKLYEAMVALEEGADLAGYMADRADGPQRSRLLQEQEQLRSHVESIRRMLEERATPAVPEPSPE